MGNPVTYKPENKEEFFAEIDRLTDVNRFTECIHALERIPKEERDYRICYQLARAYQNFAIVGDDEKGTSSFIGDKWLLKSIEILNSVKEEGKDKAEWNMRMAYGYQYLTEQEAKALPYARRWAELDLADEDALAVVKECEEEIEKRKQEAYVSADRDVSQETIEIKEDWGIYLCHAFACDLPAVVRVNLSLIDFELTSNYHKRLTLQVLYRNADKSGFPTMEEGENLCQIEEAVVGIIENHGDILSGVVKCDERMHIFAYAKNELGYADEISEVMAFNFPDYAYTFAAFEDPDWEMFNARYPDRYEYQSIMNMRLIEAIKNDGDSMAPRVLEHCLYFKTKENREAFLTKVMEEGFQKLESESDEGSEAINTEYLYQLVVGRKDDFENIDEIVWYLMDAAEEFDGDYDGWGCSAVPGNTIDSVKDKGKRFH